MKDRRLTPGTLRGALPTVARVPVPVTTKMFGNRVFLEIAARTPKARAVALRSVFLPRLR